MSSAPMASSSSRRPYHGSCHCGKVRYIAFVALPPAVGLDINRQNTLRFYKCNCSTCHKTGFFHMRLPNPAQDFVLLSPTDPDALSNYTCFEEYLNWFFCSTCGVRCFTAATDGRSEEIDLEAKLGKPSEGKLTRIWRMGEEKWQPGKKGYLSINLHTIDQGQDGLDLRELVDKKWVEYLDCKEETSPLRYDYPQNGGTW
ncbi:predicted protein [Uncinocarpus reesii 1704]|uniref:CENP-V/GFA domain-containing protein n=1 Tax=Uncinocarpus reesii (strain UAMH 1704) TaxID=336963 RepID=C4JJF9_UNCRE|nr:uncharacterized protein UREG_01766 [Uncinocarpus reesii 1704]EEP76917.1 predicted protein [Uncinocarpus reesii 1704]